MNPEEKPADSKASRAFSISDLLDQTLSSFQKLWGQAMDQFWADVAEPWRRFSWSNPLDYFLLIPRAVLAIWTALEGFAGRIADFPVLIPFDVLRSLAEREIEPSWGNKVLTRKQAYLETLEFLAVRLPAHIADNVSTNIWTKFILWLRKKPLVRYILPKPSWVQFLLDRMRGRLRIALIETSLFVMRAGLYLGALLAIGYLSALARRNEVYTSTLFQGVKRRKFKLQDNETGRVVGRIRRREPGGTRP